MPMISFLNIGHSLSEVFSAVRALKLTSNGAKGDCFSAQVVKLSDGRPEERTFLPIPAE